MITSVMNLLNRKSNLAFKDFLSPNFSDGFELLPKDLAFEYEL